MLFIFVGCKIQPKGWIFVTVFEIMQNKMVKEHLLFFVFGCNMKTNGIVAAQHPKSTRKKKTNKKATPRVQEKEDK